MPRRHSKKRVSASVTAQNNFTDGVTIFGGASLVITGTWVATVTLQRSPDAGATWVDDTDNAGNAISFTANQRFQFTEYSNDIQYRAGVKTGGFTSGTVVMEIQQ